MNTENVPQTSQLHAVKQFFLATFYGIRQCVFQLFCWELFELIVNLMGLYLFGDHHAFLVQWSAQLCIIVFTMLYHWVAMLIPKEKAFVRFVIPYIICVVFWLGGFIQVGLIVPFVCQFFFLVENYLKKKLATYPKAFKRFKIVYNIITLLPFFVFVALEYTWPYRHTGFEKLSETYELSLPRSYASKVTYPNDSQEGVDYGVIKQVRFLKPISQESISKMDTLCERTKRMKESPKGIICNFPCENNIQSEQTGMNFKADFSRSWSKEGTIYRYSAEAGRWCYYFLIDTSTNTAIEERYNYAN